VVENLYFAVPEKRGKRFIEGSSRMKQGGLILLCVLIGCLLIPGLAADDRTVNLESKVIESFDAGDANQTLDVTGAPVHWDWRASEMKADASDPSGKQIDAGRKSQILQYTSKFIHFETDKDGKVSSPRIAYVNSWPLALHGSNPKNKDELRVLGVKASFDRKEYNTIKLVPFKTVDGQEVQTKIPLPGRVKNLDVWVWGSGYNFHLYAYVEDYKGIPYKLDLGSLDFEGWRNLRTNIPDNVPQSQSYLPKHLGLSLLCFIVETNPNERVDSFQIFFDQVKVLTDLFESLYDGDGLASGDAFASSSTEGK
jgi:hypothetical protein